MSRYFDLLKMLENEKNGIAPAAAQATAPTTPEEAVVAATAQQAVQPTQTIVNDIIETNLEPSSVTPINSNIINDLTIYNDFRNTGAYAQSIGGIDTLRHPDANGMHFGNPFSPNSKSAASVYVPTIKDSVIAFGNWLKGDPQYANVEPERRQWIINQINSGSLKGKPLVYYTNNIPDNSYGVKQYNAKTAPNHAHILLDYINNGIPALDKGTQQFYEVSTAGDSRFSALNATFKPGTNIFGQDVSNRTIESVYQHGVKQGDWITNNNYKTGRPLSKAIITGNTEDDSYVQGYLPLWKEWAKQNPDLIKDLRTKSKGMQLSDKFAKTRVSQARALTDILAMPIDKGTVQMNNIPTELPLPKGKVISASYRTDIPAFFSKQLENAIKQGYIDYSPSYGKQARVSLKPEDVQVMELWTKNPKPMLNNGTLQTLKDTYGNRFYFQYSLNNYDRALEANIPDDAIDTFKKLSNEVGKDRVIWRYDPIIMSNDPNGPYTVQGHLDNYRRLAKELAPYTTRNVISFVDEYGKIKPIFKKLNLRAPNEAEQIALAKGISEINKEYGLDISTCAESGDFEQFGIRHGACTDPVIIEQLSGEKALPKNTVNRGNCGCAANIDIGSFNTCNNGCTYCYATTPSLNNNEHTSTGFRSTEELLATLAGDKGTQQMGNVGKVIYSDDIYTRDLVSSNPNTLYLFGDNTNDRTVTHYIPSQTQAVIRGLPNAIGLDTKHNRGLQPNSYFTDADYDTIMKHYDQQFADIENKLKQGYNVVIPSAGIGTGKAQLQTRAPRIYMNLSNRLNDLAMRYPDKGTQQMQELDLSLPKYIESAFNPNKALASTMAKDVYDKQGNILAHKNDIVLRKFPSEDPIRYFFNYISGTDNSPSSMQKKAVLDKLIADKHINSIDDLKSLITNEDDLKRFLLWHEKSHVDNNDADIYFANGRDRMTPDKLDIETRATVDAINKLRVYKGLGSVPTEQLLKVISGGQTGADIMGVSIAKKHGLPTGGTIGILPNGQFITEVNNYGQNNTQWDDKIDRSQFGFTTTTNQNYPYRTKQNVLNSDGTIYFTDGLDSRGYKATSREAQAAGKPFLVNPKTADEAYNFIKSNNIKTLNIAGNRGSQMSPEFRLSTEQLLDLLLSKFKK